MMGGMRAIQFVDRYPVQQLRCDNRVTVKVSTGEGSRHCQCHLFISPQSSTSYVKICTEIGEEYIQAEASFNLD